MREVIQALPLGADRKQVEQQVVATLLNQEHVDGLTGGRGWLIGDLWDTAGRLTERMVTFMAEVATQHPNPSDE